MSLIQKLRDKSAVVLAILIVISLLAFLLQDAFVGSTSRLFQREDDPNTILKVDGKYISYHYFDEVWKTMEEGYKQRGIMLEKELKYNVLDNLWEQFFTEQLMVTDAQKLGVKVTQQDITNMFLGSNIPQYVKEQLTGGHPENYKRDEVRKYLMQIQQLKDADQRKRDFEAKFLVPMTDRLRTEKYIALLKQSSYNPQWLVRKNQQDETKILSLDYVLVPYSQAKIDTVRSEEVNTYVQEHKVAYAQDEEVRQLNLLLFNAAPTAMDTLKVFKELQHLYQPFQEAKDIRSFLLAHVSSTPFDGRYLKSRDFIRLPHQEVLLRLATNQVYGPYYYGGGYQLAKKIGERLMPDSVLCRHILIATKDAASGREIRTEDEAQSLIDSVRGLLKKGSKFEDLVKQFSADEGSKNNGGVYTFSYADYAQLAKEFADAVLLGKVGDKRVVKTIFGYHYIEVLSQRGVSPVYQIAFLTQPIKASKNTMDSVLSEVNHFLVNVRSVADMDSTLKGAIPLRKQQVKKEDYSFPVVGFARNIVKWAFDVKEGAVSEIYSLGDYYVVAGMEKIYPEGSIADNEKGAIVAQVRREQAAKWIKEHTKETILTTVASKYHTQVEHITRLRWNAKLIPAIGIDDEALGGFFATTPTNKLYPVQGHLGVYYVQNKVITATKENISDLPNQKYNNREEEHFTRSALQALKSILKVENYKYKFY